MRRFRKAVLFLTMLLLLVAFPVTAYASEESTETARVTFTNVSNDQPDLYVKKTVTSVLEGYTVPTGVKFTFILKWDLNKDGTLETASNETYTLYDANGTVISDSMKTGADGSFTLEDGQTAKFDYVGKNITYEVTETNLEELNASGLYNGTFTQTTPAGAAAATGTVDANGTVVYFENSYIPKGEGETGELMIRKDISWTSDYEMPGNFDMGTFTFTVEIADEPYAGQVYSLYDTSSGDEITATEDDYDEGNAIEALDDDGNAILDSDDKPTYVFVTDENGQFTMAAGQYAVFEEVEVPADYCVTEAATDGWYAVGDITRKGATESPIVYLTFANAPTGLIVEKDMWDVNTEDDTGFIFQLLKKENGEYTVAAGQAYYLYESDSTLAETNSAGNEVTQPLMTDGDGKFTLDAGQRAVFYQLTAGDEYKVSEIDLNTTEYDEDAVKDQEITVSEELQTVSFVNSRLGSVTLLKQDQDGNVIEGVVFTLYEADGVTVYTAANDSVVATGNGTYLVSPDGQGMLSGKKTDADGKVTFSNLPVGNYIIKETYVPEGYLALEDPIEVTIPYTVTQNYVISNKIDTSDAVYDEENALYYFYDLTYTVTNKAVVQLLPSTGVMNWPLILVSVAGCLIAVAAAVVLLLMRQRRMGGAR